MDREARRVLRWRLTIPVGPEKPSLANRIFSCYTSHVKVEVLGVMVMFYHRRT
jgi:hypothetical protein